MAKVCSRCEFEGNPLRDFERWDKLCRNCRQWVGPRKRTHRGIGEPVVRVPRNLRGFADGAAKAMETHAEALDRALSKAAFDPDLTRMLQMLSRHCKGQAAEQQQIKEEV